MGNYRCEYCGSEKLNWHTPGCKSPTLTTGQMAGEPENVSAVGSGIPETPTTLRNGFVEFGPTTMTLRMAPADLDEIEQKLKAAGFACEQECGALFIDGVLTLEQIEQVTGLKIGEPAYDSVLGMVKASHLHVTTKPFDNVSIDTTGIQPLITLKHGQEKVGEFEIVRDGWTSVCLDSSLKSRPIGAPPELGAAYGQEDRDKTLDALSAFADSLAEKQFSDKLHKITMDRLDYATTSSASTSTPKHELTIDELTTEELIERAFEMAQCLTWVEAEEMMRKLAAELRDAWNIIQRVNGQTHMGEPVIGIRIGNNESATTQVIMAKVKAAMKQDWLYQIHCENVDKFGPAAKQREQDKLNALMADIAKDIQALENVRQNDSTKGGIHTTPESIINRLRVTAIDYTSAKNFWRTTGWNDALTNVATALAALRPYGYVLHWPSLGGRTQKLFSDTPAAAKSIGCEYTPVYTDPKIRDTPVPDDYTLVHDVELAGLRRRANVAMQCERGELWYWQGDGQDFPESLACPVVMSPYALRELLDKTKAASEPAAWVDVPDGDQLAEDYSGYKFFGIKMLTAGRHHLYTRPPVQQAASVPAGKVYAVSTLHGALAEFYGAPPVGTLLYTQPQQATSVPEEIREATPRARELAERLVASGPKCCAVSASETHEISEFVESACDLIESLSAASEVKA